MADRASCQIKDLAGRVSQQVFCRPTAAQLGEALAERWRVRGHLSFCSLMLTDSQCVKASCDADRSRMRLTDSGGLFLEVSHSCSKCWFWDNRFIREEN